MSENDEPIEQTVVQDEAERLRSKDRSSFLSRPEVPGYEVETLLGAGSYGEVWLALQKNTGRKVAIKFFSRFKGLDWPLLQREVGKLVEVLSERRVVHLLQVGWDADPPYYVMEYLAGGSLADKIAGRTLPAKDAVRVFRDVAEALVYLHGKAILHCDLKPANVLLDDRNQIRLADFGQARLSSEEGPALGTLFYMAPEQAETGARPDVRSDIYSLGALVHTMLTGKPPYATEEASDGLASSRSTKERIARYRELIETSPTPTAHHRCEDVDRSLAEIVDRCLKKAPAERFQNVPQVIEALDLRERTLEGEGDAGSISRLRDLRRVIPWDVLLPREPLAIGVARADHAIVEGSAREHHRVRVGHDPIVEVAVSIGFVKLFQV